MTYYTVTKWTTSHKCHGKLQ